MLAGKKRIDADKILDQFLAVGVGGHAMGRDQGQEQRLPGRGDISECLQLRSQFGRIFLIDHEFPIAELELADVDHVVLSIDQQVDLGPAAFPALRLMAPGRTFGLHAGYAESLLDLRHVLEAHPLESVPGPGPPSGRAPNFDPMAFAIQDMAGGLDPAQVEQRQLVDQAKKRLPLLVPKGGDPANEPRRLQFGERGGHRSSAGQLRQPYQLLAGEPGRLSAEGSDHLEVAIVMLEERDEQFLELIAERGVGCEVHGVDALRRRPALADVIQVVGHPAYRERQLDQLLAVELYARRVQVGFNLMEAEWLHGKTAGDPIVQTPFLVKDLGDHPGRGRPANHDDQVALLGGPPIPELLERWQKPRAARRKPGQLVEERDASALPQLKVKIARQLVEGLGPIAWRGMPEPGAGLQGLGEIGQLPIQGCLPGAGQLEAKLRCEKVPDEVGLADSAAPIDRDELRTAGFEGEAKLLLLVFAADQRR